MHADLFQLVVGERDLEVLRGHAARPATAVGVQGVALGAVGSEAAGLVLRLKVRLGDKDPDVFSECLGGLLAVDATANLSIVTEFLDPTDPASCEAAARTRPSSVENPTKPTVKMARFSTLACQRVFDQGAMCWSMEAAQWPSAGREKVGVCAGIRMRWGGRCLCPC